MGSLILAVVTILTISRSFGLPCVSCSKSVTVKNVLSGMKIISKRFVSCIGFQSKIFSALNYRLPFLDVLVAGSWNVSFEQKVSKWFNSEFLKYPKVS